MNIVLNAHNGSEIDITKREVLEVKGASVFGISATCQELDIWRPNSRLKKRQRRIIISMSK